MLYEDFRGTITQVLIAEKKLNIRDENIVVHYKGEVADDERGRLWIKDANQKYYQKESDTLLGDFLVIELEHLGETSMVIRYDLQSLYGAYCSSGWDAVFENVEDKLNMCKSGQEKIKHIANYEKMCDWLVVRPVNYVERKSALQKAIYKRVGDMALVIYILLYADQNNYNTCLCQKEIVENWDVSEEELWEVAMRNTMMDALQRKGIDTIGVGKISDIFAGRSISRSLGINQDNVDGMDKTLKLMDEDFTGLCFVNLVDFDMQYGHRRDVDGYAEAATVFDRQLGQFMAKMRDDDVLMITADHGCDPGAPGTDHTREYVPLLIYGRQVKAGVNLGTYPTFAMIAATISDIFDCDLKTKGESLLPRFVK